MGGYQFLILPLIKMSTIKKTLVRYKDSVVTTTKYVTHGIAWIRLLVVNTTFDKNVCNKKTLVRYKDSVVTTTKYVTNGIAWIRLPVFHTTFDKNVCNKKTLVRYK